MLRFDTQKTGRVGKWSPKLFLAAGLLVAGHGAIKAVEAFTHIAPPPDVFGPAGYLLAVVGMLTLYPALSDETRLARVAATVAVVPAAGWVAILALTVGEYLGVTAGVTAGLLMFAHAMALFATYVLFAVASLRSDVHPNAVGVLLLMPAVLLVAIFAGAAIGASAVGAFLVGTGQAVVHLSVGAVLPTGVDRPDHATAGAAAD